MRTNGRRISLLAMMLLLIAASGMLLLLRPSHGTDDAIHYIVAAADAMPYRPQIARVSGGFAYRPLNTTMRSAGHSVDADSSRWPLLAAAAATAKDSQP